MNIVEIVLINVHVEQYLMKKLKIVMNLLVSTIIIILKMDA